MWKTIEADGGYRLTYDGRRWPMEPRPTRDEADAYRERLEDRYPDAEVLAVLDYANEDEDTGRSRGGPWRWDLPDGTSGVVHLSRLADAKDHLRRKMGRKRLPNGITWEIAN